MGEKKQMIHYHGTPLTPRSELMKMAGKHFCVSFAAPGDADVCAQIGQSVMYDNGAFSAFTKGKEFDTFSYYEWVGPRIGHPHWAIIPDVIDGSVDDQRDRVGKWPFPASISAPVWHMGLPIDYLLELADEWPRICFGSTAQYWQVGSDDWARRADEAFNALAKRHTYLPWIHMLRGLSLCGDQWPFASADSVNVARNFKDHPRICPERMARRIDAVQCPIKWTATHQQQEMFACS